MTMATRIYVHITWTTRDRRPMITAATKRFLQRFLVAEAARHGARSLALDMVSDHVHVVLELPAAFDLPRLVQGLKGASARLINANESLTAVGLRWARGYDARSVSPSGLGRVIAYVKSQSDRHPDRAIPRPRVVPG
jgi:putative transposase